jgi:hypothetical protein
MAAILTRDPPQIDSSTTECPPDLASLLNRCLEKDVETRFRSARDLSFALTHLLRNEASRTIRRRSSRLGVVLTAAAFQRWPFLPMLKVDPAFDSLRSDARFGNLVRGLGLER